jgi:hypothetical protein
MFHFYSLFYYFHSISFHIDVREIDEVQCVLSYGVSLTIHCAIMHQSRRTSWHHSAHNPRRVSSVCILGVHPGVHPSFIRRAPDVHSVLHLRSNLTFGQILPRILEQVLCPRCSTFILFFITFHFIPFIDVREIYDLHRVFIHTVCLLRYNVSFTIHLAIMHQSGDHPRRPSPAYIPGVHPRRPSPGVYPRCVSRHNSGTHSVLYLRSILTFGHILPRILEQVLCPRCSTFLSIFITFIPFHSISMFERFMKYNVSFTIHCVQHQISRTSILYSTFFIIF